MPETILVVDLGSQYTQLIARRIREHRVYSKIVSHKLSAAEARESGVRGLVLSGGPGSIYEHDSPRVDPELFELGIGAAALQRN